MCNSIINILNSPAIQEGAGSHGMRFPLCKDQDTFNLLGGNYLMIEAKHIFIAAMAHDVWGELCHRFHQFDVMEPSECPAGYRISQAMFWPASADSQTAGVVALAADQQADIVADTLFQRLMYIGNKSTAKAHGALAKKAEQARAQQMDMDSDAEESTVDLNTAGSASRASSTSRGPRTPTVAADEMDIDDVSASGAAATQELLPSAWNVSKTYRLTRDWTKWPSAGPVNSEVSNCQQAQYGIIADLIFETTKIEVKKAKSHVAGGLLGDRDLKLAEFARDTGAQTVYFKILTAYAQTGKVLRKKASTNIVAEAADFMNFVFNKWDGDFAFNNDASEDKQFDIELNQFSKDLWPQVFVTLSKQQQAVEKEQLLGGDGQSVVASDTQSIDDSVSLTERSPAAGPSRRASSPQARGRGRGRPRGSRRARGDPTTRPKRPSPLAGKRGRDENDGADEDSNEDDEPSTKRFTRNTHRQN